MMTRTTCGLKAPSIGSGIKVAGAENLGGIPESLVVYRAVSTLFLLLYFPFVHPSEYIIIPEVCAQGCYSGIYDFCCQIYGLFC